MYRGFNKVIISHNDNNRTVRRTTPEGTEVVYKAKIAYVKHQKRKSIK